MATKFKKGDIVIYIYYPNHESFPAIIVDTEGTVPGQSYRMLSTNQTEVWKSNLHDTDLQKVGNANIDENKLPQLISEMKAKNARHDRILHKFMDGKPIS